MPRTELTSSRPLTQPFTVQLRMRPGFQGTAGLRRTCGCSCPDVKYGEDLNHIASTQQSYVVWGQRSEVNEDDMVVSSPTVM